jgi:hypothetical protein
VLGDLAARSGPFKLSVVVAVGATAVPFTTLHSPVAIQPGNAELETLNNNAQSVTFIGHLVFLPVMNR